MSLNKTLFAALALAASMAMLSNPAAAQVSQSQQVSVFPEMMMKAADADNDGMVTRKEFLDHMTRVWDQRHAKMMKADTSMKAGMMDKTQFMAFARGIVNDPSYIGGN